MTTSKKAQDKNYKNWKKNKELQEKDQEKQEALKELEKRSHTLELQHKELYFNM